MVPILLCKLHLEALVSSINVLITQPFSTAWTTPFSVVLVTVFYLQNLM